MEKLLVLVKGMPYLVKIKRGNRVTRIFKYEETRFGNIKCFVFTSRVKRGVYAEVKETDTERIYKWKNTQKPPASEISIPYYDLISVTPAPIR